MNNGIKYDLFYEILLRLREIFHSYGRFDDSNEKLDEITKLLMLSYYYAKKGEYFSLQLVRNYSLRNFSTEDKTAESLRLMFKDAALSEMYKNLDGTSIFGANPNLSIQASENNFCEQVISEIEKIDFINLLEKNNISDFDIINECFGHFVRDNFRNNKEDAQYMTPAEIVNPILDMVFSDFNKEKYNLLDDSNNFTIMDPTCGVGTLLIESSKRYLNIIDKAKIDEQLKNKLRDNFLKNGIVGQDKVDRMVRLSKINALLANGNIHNIVCGNSISDDSYINRYFGKVDFIFTNPPFGAEYNIADLSKTDFEFLDRITISSKTISSEILMLLKCIKLLKNKGKLAIVLPDSVFSAKGINEQIRKVLLDNFIINAIIDMPAVTFAQAGTRTKTSILYMTKEQSDTRKNKIFMSSCKDIGYSVKERMGVPVKIQTEKNEMPVIAECYLSKNNNCMILSSSPSATLINRSDLINNILNPNFYDAERLNTIKKLTSSTIEGIEFKPLSDIVSFETVSRNYEHVTEETKHISVLHINSDSTIDFKQVYDYAPICKGRKCYSGDILFSKINPRIPRMTVIPKDIEKKLVCSNEFEIMKPKTDIGAYTICFLLKTSYVMNQIENLTSGTSSSHNRIKREQLEKILIPYPVSVELKNEFAEINTKLSKSLSQKYAAENSIESQINILENFKI